MDEIDASVENKTVKVVCNDTVEKQVLLEALLKWGKASDKSVELIS